MLNSDESHPVDPAPVEMSTPLDDWGSLRPSASSVYRADA
jgi:hypothetical protein